MASSRDDEQTAEGYFIFRLSLQPQLSNFIRFHAALLELQQTLMCKIAILVFFFFHIVIFSHVGTELCVVTDCNMITVQYWEKNVSATGDWPFQRKLLSHHVWLDLHLVVGLEITQYDVQLVLNTGILYYVPYGIQNCCYDHKMAEIDICVVTAYRATYQLCTC